MDDAGQVLGRWRIDDSPARLTQGRQEALRILANRLVGILHGCLRHRHLYREDIAWPLEELAAA